MYKIDVIIEIDNKECVFKKFVNNSENKNNTNKQLNHIDNTDDILNILSMLLEMNDINGQLPKTTSKRYGL